MQITPTAIPNPTQGVPYALTLTASGGTAPYTFSLPSYHMPAGLVLSAAGVISGTPTTPGNPVYIRATDSTGQSITQHYAITCNPPQTKTLLSGLNLSYQGQYFLNVGLAYSNGYWSGGLTCRRVNGDLRLMTLLYRGAGASPNYGLVEFSLAGLNYGDTIQSYTQKWDDLWAGIAVDPEGNSYGGGASGNKWMFADWDEANQRLWTTSAVGYPDSTQQAMELSLCVRSLNPDGTIANQGGPWGLQGVNPRTYYGGWQPVPAWFQSQYGAPANCVGWGGYSSEVGTGTPTLPALGPTLFFFQEPTQYPNGSIIPCGAGMCPGDAAVGGDWYAAGAPSTFDRGIRVDTNILNYLQDPNYPPNPQGFPAGYGPPSPQSQWLSPAPDGLGRWSWNDTVHNTGCWIDLPTKHGFLLMASLGCGKNYYSGSTTYCDSVEYEMQFYDPYQIGDVALKNNVWLPNGTVGPRPSWFVRPGNVAEYAFGSMGYGVVGDGVDDRLHGMVFDPVSGHLFLIGSANFGGTYTSSIFDFIVQ